jgi:hypothetical protein
MSLFGFFHRSEMDKFISAVKKRKRNLLHTTKHLFAEEKKMMRLSELENHLLASAKKLDPTEKAAVDKVIAENRTEEQILNYLARIEKQVVSLIESRDVEAIRTRLKKYIYVIDQLTRRIGNLENTKKAQMARITEEEEKLARDAERKAFGKTVQDREDKKKALELMKQSLKVEKKENAIARKRFFRSVSGLGTGANKLMTALMKLTSEAAKAAEEGAKIAGNVGKIGTAVTKKTAEVVAKALK